MLSACFAFHNAASARLGVRPPSHGKRRARSGPGTPPGCQGRALTPSISRHQHTQPAPSKFQAGSKFLCSGFSAKMAKAALPHPVCSSLRSFFAFLSSNAAEFGTGTGLPIPPSAPWVCKFWPHRSTMMNV